MSTSTPLAPTSEEVWAALRVVCDPELPGLTIEDLGILRDVALESGRVVVTITPTYSGCPALREIEDDVIAACAGQGWTAEVRTVLAPAWTTDWITPAGLQALRDEGIALPGPRPAGPVALTLTPPPPRCPQCSSPETEELSRFGATSCQSLWRCLTCREGFTRLKPH